MRKESAASISSRSAVSYRMLAIALLSTDQRLNKIGVQCQRQGAERNCWVEKQNRISGQSVSGWPCGIRESNWPPFSGALGDVGGLRSLLSFGDFELHRVAFLQALVALGSDCAVMYKNVRAIRAPDEAVALCVIEPLDRTFQTFHVPPLSARPSVGEPKDVPAYDAFWSDCDWVSRRNACRLERGDGGAPRCTWLDGRGARLPTSRDPTFLELDDPAREPRRWFLRRESCRSLPFESRQAARPCAYGSLRRPRDAPDRREARWPDKRTWFQLRT